MDELRKLAVETDTEMGRASVELDKLDAQEARMRRRKQTPTPEMARQRAELTATLDATRRTYLERRWTRFYLVPRGHVHRSTGCPTLRWNTSIFLMPEYSGMDTEEFVDLAGERACTKCYPNAPVHRPSMLPVHVAEREADAAELAAKAAEKAQKEAAAITDALGTRVIFKTRRAAENHLSSELGWALNTMLVKPVDEAHAVQLQKLVNGYLNNVRSTLQLLEMNGITDVDMEKKISAQRKKTGYSGAVAL